MNESNEVCGYLIYGILVAEKDAGKVRTIKQSMRKCEIIFEGFEPELALSKIAI